MIPEEILHEIRMMVSGVLGWDFPPNRRNDLVRGIVATARDFSVKETPEAIATWLSEISWNTGELDVLTSYLTVGETYFFREKSGLDIFQKQIIPGIINSRQGKDQYIRIWCAGCCTGEEPYTLAILLRGMIPDIQNWKITILATDINRHFLKKAQAGSYTQWSFRETSHIIKNQYFSHTGKNWEINPEIKKMVTFAYLNLADDLYPSTLTNTHNMDVVFCRNVLMYFTSQQIKQTARRFYKSIVDKGWLITSAVELNDDHFSDFASIRYEQGIFYQKVPKKSQPVILPVSKRATSIVSKPRKPVLQQSKHLTAEIAIRKEEVSSSRHEIQILFDKGRYQHCIEMCLVLLVENPRETKALTILVKSYANMGNLTEARKWGEKLLHQDGTEADSYYLVATIQMEENDPELAESTLKRALYLDPHHLLSHFLLGSIMSRQGKKRTAVKHFQNVNELLEKYQENEVVPGSDGLTAGRIREIVGTMTQNTNPLL